MKNPLLDAIKQMKAKRVAIMVGDADELGLPDMIEGVHEDTEEPGEEMTDPNESQEDPAEEMEAEQGEADDAAEGEAEQADEEIPSQAEQVMGRKPFDKSKPLMAKGEDQSSEIPDSVAQDLYDPEMVNKMRASGKKPSGLMARAQAGLAKRFGK